MPSLPLYGDCHVTDRITALSGGRYSRQHYRKHDARPTAVTVNPFNVIEAVEYPKGTVGSKPFKNDFTGRKNRADCDGADTAYSAYVLVPHQMKYAHHGVLFFSGALAGFVSGAESDQG